MAVQLETYFFLTLLTFAILPGESEAAFGQTIDDKVTDFRFKNMGEAYISEFEIVDSKANFEVVLEVSHCYIGRWVTNCPFTKVNQSSMHCPVDLTYLLYRVNVAFTFRQIVHQSIQERT